MITKLHKIFTIVLVLAGIQTAFAQYADRKVADEPENVSVIFNNGSFTTGATTASGVAAPDGFLWSESAANAQMTASNSTLGYGTTFPAVRLADNFTVPAGQTWTITSVTAYGLVQGWQSPESPFSGGVLQIWNGKPGEAGSTVVFGDLTTDRLLSSKQSKVYAIAHTLVPTPRNPDTQRQLFTNKLSVAPSLTLGPGTYWIDFATSSYNNVFAQFARQVVTPGSRTQPDWNAIQFSASSGQWTGVLSNAFPSSEPQVAQDIAFEVNGTVSTGRNASKFADYDGDGTTDFGVTRWGVSPVSPSQWFILKNNGTNVDSVSYQYGFRAGTSRAFNGVGLLDVVLPEDYDGDGKADIAVYRDGGSTAEPQSYFYILRSSDGTLDVEPWGQRFDVGSIMGDYDGDGKADMAVYRPGATTGAQSSFYVKKSSDGGFVSAQLGIRGDRPVLGDYDGDGKQDFSVFRFSTTTGESDLYTLRSSDGQMMTTNLPFQTAFIVPGDYDGDGTTDVATIRSSLNNMVWTIYRSSDNVVQTTVAGIYSNSFPVQGDYNADGKTDIAVYYKTGTGSANPSAFWVRQDNGFFKVTPWGNGFDNSISSIRAY